MANITDFRRTIRKYLELYAREGNKISNQRFENDVKRIENLARETFGGD